MPVNGRFTTRQRKLYDIVRDLLVSLDPHVRIVSAEGRGIAGADSLRSEETTLPQVETRGLADVETLMAMALATQNLGLGATYSTSYYQPFHVARVFATLDHLTFNLITSSTSSAACSRVATA